MSNKLVHARELADIMVRRYAQKELGISLPQNYWRLPKWKAMYGQQIIAANGLLNVYSIDAIRAALKRKDGSWQWSLRTKALIPIIKEEQTKIEVSNRTQQKQEQDKVTEFKDPSKVVIRKQEGGKKQSLRSKLD